MTQLTIDTLDHEPVTHVITPDFSTLCRDDYLKASDRGDRLAISVPGGNWAQITCPWCHSLGRAYYGHAIHRMQRRAA